MESEKRILPILIKINIPDSLPFNNHTEHDINDYFMQIRCYKQSKLKISKKKFENL